ncbi:hypothetical protein VHEMI01348 [[Torrubiella] hemipterigena]|nr:hypothetical protein VHEMI01348 [[Torrubiella] hemipterigena]
MEGIWPVSPSNHAVLNEGVSHSNRLLLDILSDADEMGYRESFHPTTPTVPLGRDRSLSISSPAVAPFEASLETFISDYTFNSNSHALLFSGHGHHRTASTPASNTGHSLSDVTPQTSRAVEMILDVERLYNFGVEIGILPEDAESRRLLQRMRHQFAYLAASRANGAGTGAN